MARLEEIGNGQGWGATAILVFATAPAEAGSIATNPVSWGVTAELVERELVITHALA